MTIEMQHINKSFGTIPVLKNVSLSVKAAEVHALVGENGAGKSSLMKILAGIYSKESGQILLDGQAQSFKSVKDSEKHGIAIVNQELNIFPQLSILENIFLDKEWKNPLGFLAKSKMEKRAEQLFEELNISLDLHQKAGKLSVGFQQMVEIAKALLVKAQLIIMDEPSSALSEKEIQTLFSVIKKLKAGGASIIYISHHLDEIFTIADRVTVMRDGKHISTQNIAESTLDKLIKQMVGYEIEDIFPERRPPRKEKPALEAIGLSQKNNFDQISFTLFQGEILGFAGLMGAGRTALMRALFGISSLDAGTLKIDGKTCSIKNPEKAKSQGMAFVTEDRKTEGLILPFSISDNFAINNLAQISQNGLMKKKRLSALTEQYGRKLEIKMSSILQKANHLSGGNQQKLVLGKWLANNPKILILDEPTRGIDVGAKREIYKLIAELKEEGISILLVSSELTELLGMSDRIIVLREGRMRATLINKAINDHDILRHMMVDNNDQKQSV